MSNNQRLFYSVWAIGWLALALCATAMITLLDGRDVLFSWEAWFATFPVAWTLALLVVRYQDRVNAFCKHPSVKRLYMLPTLLVFALTFWSRGVRKDDLMFKTLGILTAAVVALLIVISVVEAVQIRRRPLKIPTS